MQQPTRTEILHILMTNLINICSFWEYRYSEWWHWSREPRILCWIKIGLKLVEKDDGLEFLQPQHWCSVHSKHRKFTHHPDDQFDQYMFVLRITTFDMMAWISCTSNTMLDRNQPWNVGARWFGIFVATALTISPQAPKISITSWWTIWSKYVRS